MRIATSCENRYAYNHEGSGYIHAFMESSSAYTLVSLILRYLPLVVLYLTVMVIQAPENIKYEYTQGMISFFIILKTHIVVACARSRLSRPRPLELESKNLSLSPRHLTTMRFYYTQYPGIWVLIPYLRPYQDRHSNLGGFAVGLYTGRYAYAYTKRKRNNRIRVCIRDIMGVPSHSF